MSHKFDSEEFQQKLAGMRSQLEKLAEEFSGEDGEQRLQERIATDDNFRKYLEGLRQLEKEIDVMLQGVEKVKEEAIKLAREMVAKLPDNQELKAELEELEKQLETPE